jgi:prepilin-type N-terminal cleavage/methylation domain-containing protein
MAKQKMAEKARFASGMKMAIGTVAMLNKSCSGFTLIEVLIALALVSALIIGGVEILILAAQIKLKADANLELADLAASCLEIQKAAVLAGIGGENAEEPAAFSITGRRRATFRGTWECGGLVESPARFGFEIYPELEPEAVFALTVLFSRELGF